MPRILDSAVSTVWAITEDGLVALREIYNQALQRSGSISAEDLEKIYKQNEQLGNSLHLQSVEALASSQGTRLNGSDYSYLFDNGIAVMNLFGPIFPRANMMTMSGATSIEQFAKDFVSTYSNPSVNGIVLQVDSSGGDVRGIKAAADLINKITISGDKPVQVFGAGLICSAAYYIASAVGDGNILADATSMTGSVGVVLSARAKGQGEYEIISSQSPYKRLDPATKAGRNQLQTIADDVAEIFVSDVATFRGITVEEVLANYGQGASMVGPRALEAGLIDGLSTLSQVVENMASSTSSHRQSLKGSSMALGLLVNLKEEDNSMNAIEGFLSKFKATSETIDATSDEQDPPVIDEEEVDDDESEGQEEEGTKAIAPVLTREELADRFAEGAELFAMHLLTDNRILPNLQAHAATSLLNARIDDKLVGGTVDYVDENGAMATGTREDSVRAMFASLPKNSLTKKAIKGIKEGTVKAVVLNEDDSADDTEEKDLSPERRQKLLGTSQQGRAVLAQG